MTMRSGLIVICLALLTAPAFAQQAAPADNGLTAVSLSEQATKTLPRDRMQADLRVEAINAEPQKLQDEINRKMGAALAKAKAAHDVEVRTTGYNVYLDRPQGQPARWHGSQSLHVSSKNFDALLALVGTLQSDGLVLSNLAADLSPEATKSAQDELTDAALKQLRARASHIASTLGTSVDRYREIHVGNANTGGIMFRVMAAAPMGSGAAAPPAAEAGDATVTVSVDATILLAPVK